jgi:hypothetical protein
LLELFCTLEGAVGPQGGRTRGRLEVLDGLRNALAQVLAIAPIATERFHEEGHTRLVLPNEVKHDVIEVRAMLATVASRDVHPPCLRFLSTVGTPIDMEAGAIEMRAGRRKSEAWRRRRGDETVEFRNAIVLERIQRASQRVIMEMLGVDPRGNEARRGFVLNKHGHAIELVMHKAQPLADHGFDGAAPGDKPGLGGLLRRAVKDVANAQCVAHPSHETEMVQDFTPVWSVHSRLLL